MSNEKIVIVHEVEACVSMANMTIGKDNITLPGLNEDYKFLAFIPVEESNGRFYYRAFCSKDCDHWEVCVAAKTDGQLIDLAYECICLDETYPNGQEKEEAET